MPADGLPAERRIARIEVDGGTEALAARFPGAVFGPAGNLPCVTVDSADWEPLTADRLVHGAELHGTFALRVRGEAPHAVLLRYQRLFPQRNRESRERSFEAALTRHRELHDLRLPLVRADHDHALDTWQWALRLAPDASLALQIAALCHDIERLTSETTTRVEWNSPDYDAYKVAHATHGARLVRRMLDGIVPARVADRVAELVSAHERRGDDPEAALLTDADGLSFFSLNRPGYLAWHGPELTARKVEWTLRRLGPSARAIALDLTERR